jgi:hypothetical protein
MDSTIEGIELKYGFYTKNILIIEEKKLPDK